MGMITEIIGDIFSAPSKSILIHACNARGVWGSGVAVAFKNKYPYVFRQYNERCKSRPPGSKLTLKQHQANLVGTALVILYSDKAATKRQADRTRRYIACLFTSLDYGKRVSPPEEILHNTGNALKDLARQMAELRELGQELGDCYAVRINSGKFGVEWQRTKAVLEAGDMNITVISLTEEGQDSAADTALGGTLEQPAIKGEGAEAEKPPAETNATGYNPQMSVQAKDESLSVEQMPGAKTKIVKNAGGDGDDDRGHMKRKEPAQIHPGIAKRRKKLGLETRWR